MAYPSFDVMLSGADDEWEDDVQIERATNGALRGRAFFSSEKGRFRFSHRLNAADAAAYRGFVTANRFSEFSFYYPRTKGTYTCIFARRPKYRPLGGGIVEISVELIEA